MSLLVWILFIYLFVYMYLWSTVKVKSVQVWFLGYAHDMVDVSVVFFHRWHFSISCCAQLLFFFIVITADSCLLSSELVNLRNVDWPVRRIRFVKCCHIVWYKCSIKMSRRLTNFFCFYFFFEEVYFDTVLMSVIDFYSHSLVWRDFRVVNSILSTS